MTELDNEIVSGKNPVLEALRSGRDMNKVWVAEGVKKAGIAELLQLAKEAGIIVSLYRKTKWIN